MVELWFGIAAITVTLYVITDGFDLGAGALHLFVARTDPERRQVLAAIGPFWDGNEVWLLATGGILFLAFPKVLASGLSGFYFAIMLVLWSLILRGIAIEFRSHVASTMWRQAWDVVFCGASALLAIFLGAALGNVLRGVPLDAQGWFSLELFTDWSAGEPVGILDWYTVLIGVFAAAALAGHGASFLALRTDGPVQARSRTLMTRLFVAVAILWPLVTLATWRVNGALFSAFPGRPIAFLAALLALAGLAAVFIGRRRGRDGQSFAGSCAFLLGLLGSAAAGLYPVMLRSSGDPSLSLTAPATAVPAAALRTALLWWIVAFPLALGYLVFLFRLHRGRAVAAADGEGY
ncbi:MAG TPA: cytochrome d ubiquinol oxidase subunit II [Patescibacteria group bacterium]|nr:cytochrome d ubiquinol oxidase subunit II [Patescibacteria group bacterium]